jgi:hypothetical protein
MADLSPKHAGAERKLARPLGVSALVRSALVTLLLVTSGCIDFWAAYEDPSYADGPGPDYADPDDLAFALLQAPRLASYSEDGEHFVVGRCRSNADNHFVDLSCEIVAVDRQRTVVPLGFGGPMHPDATREVRGPFAKRLDRLHAHMMEDTGPIVSAVEGGHKVTTSAPFIRLDYVKSYDSPAATPLAAVSVAGRFELGDVRGSFRRRDAVAVEVWQRNEADGLAYNAWVLFVRNPDMSWRSIIVPAAFAGAPVISPVAP